MRRLFAFLLICIVTLNSCVSQNNNPTKKPTIIVSVPPYAYFIKKIGGDQFDVRSLVPPGTDPHTYEPTPKEVENLQQAVLWIKLGEAFDKKVHQVFKEQKRNIKIVEITKGIDLLSYCNEGLIEVEKEHCSHGHTEGKDLHVWMSLRLAKTQAENITSALIELYPQQEVHFKKNLQHFIHELESVDSDISQLLTSMRGKAILVSHPAFGYFCEDYGITQISIEMEGKEPLPQYITNIIEKIKVYDIKSVILQPQSNNKGAKLIAQELKLSTHLIDPCAENYTDNLRTFAKLLID